MKNSIIFALVVAVAALVLGCASVKAARKAQKPDSELAGERTVKASEVGLEDGIVLTLDRAVEIAMSYHPSIIQSKNSLEQSRKQFEDARAAFKPSSSASANYRLGTSNSTAGNETNKTNDSFSAGLSLNQLIYDFGSTSASVRQSFEAVIIAECSLLSAQNMVRYNIRQAYYNLIEQQALVKVAEETLQQYKQRHEQVSTLYEVGRRIKYDVTKSEVDLGNSEISLLNAQNALRNARAALNSALGLAENPGYDVEDTDDTTFAPSFDELYEFGLDNQPELVIQEARVRSLSCAIDQAISDLYPSLSLNGSFNLSGTTFPMVWNWSLGTALSQVLFNGNRNTNQIDEAVLSFRSARAKKSELEQQLYLNLSQAFALLESANKRREISALVVQTSKDNLNLVQERYSIGMTSSVELTDAMVSLTNAQTQELQARFEYRKAVASIQKLTGMQDK